MTITDVLWTVPLKVRLQNGLERTFRSVYEALDFLEHEWPLKRGERHQRAVSVCRRALNCMVPPVVAQESFIAACLEAGMSSARIEPIRSAHPQKARTMHLR
jgi:hypothetical protein